MNTTVSDAISTAEQLGTLRAEEDALIQSQVDAQASLGNLNAQLRVNLDSLRVNVATMATVDISATVGAISVTVNGGAETIQATLGARTNRLLVNVIADLDVLHVATLHAVANVDTTRLNVNLSALVRKLRLDLSLLVQNLSVSAHSDVAAAITAEASLSASIAAEVDDLKANLTANVDGKISGLEQLQLKDILALNRLLSSSSSALQSIRSQVG